MISTGCAGLTSGPITACASAALDDNVAMKTATKALSPRINGSL